MFSCTRITALALLAACLALSPVVASADPRLLGRPLAEALEELRAGGMAIIYTTNLVLEGMRVAGELPAGDPRSALKDLLVPHGLEAREGEAGRLVVVSRSVPPEALIVAGVVRDRAGVPIGGATVRVAQPPLLATTDGQGQFHLQSVPVGPLEFAVTRAGFLPRSFTAEGRAGQSLLFDVTLVVTPVELDEIEVTPSRIKLLADRLSTVGLDRESLASLPRLANDPLRALTVFPGTSGSERSAGLNVRGGRQDEVMVVLDGLEIVEPFHLKEFGNALSVVSPGTVAGVELMTGGFPAEYGDRMSGVLELTTAAVSGTRRVELGLSAIDLQALGAAMFGGRARVLASVRAGSLEPAFEAAGKEEDPGFFDLFSKVAWSLGEHQDIRLQALVANDDLGFRETDDDQEERIQTRYRNTYLWLTHQAVVGTSWLAETLVSASRLKLGRVSSTSDDAGQRALMDDRAVEIVGLRQRWSRRFGDRHALRWGLEAREIKADYQYLDERRFRGPLARALGREDTGARGLARQFRGQQFALHVTERWRPVPSLTFDIGARLDESTLTDDEFVSPRTSLAWSPRATTTVRAAWGHFYQSHRPNELRVEDGETEFQPAERAEHRIVGIDHRFEEGAGWAARLGLRLRVEIYDHEIAQPRPRYENLFEPFSLAPELEPDRVRVDPTRSRARGLEVLLRGRYGARVGWLLAYTRSRTEDRIGSRWVPRGIDQPNALNAAIDLTLGWGLRLNAAWRYHTGWPTTAVSANVVTGAGGAQAELILGPRFGQRLPDYHRLDIRLARTWNLPRGGLEAFVEVQNAYLHRNVLGFEVDVEEDDSAEIELAPIVGSKALPWAGVVWRF